MGLFGKKKKNEEFVEEYTPIGTDATLNDDFLDSFEDSRDVVSLFGSNSKEGSLKENNNSFFNDFSEPIQRNNEVDGVEGRDVASLFGNSNSLNSNLNMSKEESTSSLFGSSKPLKRNSEVDGVEGRDVASLFGNSNSLKSNLNMSKEESSSSLFGSSKPLKRNREIDGVEGKDVTSLFGNSNSLKSNLNMNKESNIQNLNTTLNEKSEAPKEIGTGDVASLFGNNNFLKNSLKEEDSSPKIDFGANEKSEAPKEIGTGDVASLFGAGGFNQLKKEPIKEETNTKETKDVASLFGVGGFNQLEKEPIKEEKVNALKQSSSLFSKSSLNNKAIETKTNLVTVNNENNSLINNFSLEDNLEIKEKSINQKSIENINIKNDKIPTNSTKEEVFIVGGTIKQFKIEQEDFSKNKKSFFKKNKNDLKIEIKEEIKEETREETREEIKNNSFLENRTVESVNKNDIKNSKIEKEEIKINEKEELIKEEPIKKEPLKKSSSLFTSSKSLNLNKQDIFTKMNKQKEEEGKIVAEKINNNTFVSIDEYYGLEEENNDIQESSLSNEEEIIETSEGQKEIILEKIEEIIEEEIIRDFKNFVFDDDFDSYEKEHSSEYFTYDELIEKITKEEEKRIANLGVDELLSEVLIPNEDIENSHIFEDAKIVTDIVQINKKEEIKEIQIIENIDNKNSIEKDVNIEEANKEEDILSILGVENNDLVDSLPKELNELDFLDIFEVSNEDNDNNSKSQIVENNIVEHSEVVDIVEQPQTTFNSNNSKYDFDIFSFLNVSKDEQIQVEEKKEVVEDIKEEIIENIEEEIKEEIKEETNIEEDEIVDVVINEEPTIYDIMKDRRKDLIKSNDLKETINVVIEKKEELKEEEAKDKKEKEKRDSFISIDEEVDANEFKTKEIDYSKLNEEFNPYKGKTDEEIEELRKKSERQRDYAETGIHKVDKDFDTSIGKIVEFEDKDDELEDDSSIDEILKIMKQNEFILDEEIKKEIIEEKVEVPQIIQSVPSPDIIALKEEKAKVKTTSEFSNFSHELGKVNKINSITNEFNLISKKINSINYNVFNDFTEFTINYRKLRNDYLDKKRAKALKEKQRLMKQLQEEEDKQKSLKSSQYDEELNKALYSGKKQSTILGNISENSHDRLMRLRGDFSREEGYDDDEIVFGRYKVKDASTSLSELNNRLPNKALYDEFIVDDFDYSEIEEPEPPNKNTFSGRGMRPPR